MARAGATRFPSIAARLDYRSWMDYTNGIISDYGNHRFDTVHQIMGAEIPLKVSSSSMRFDGTAPATSTTSSRPPTSTRTSS